MVGSLLVLRLPLAYKELVRYGYFSLFELAKELEPGLNALFGMEYSRYENQHAEIFDTETSDRAFEEEVMLSASGWSVLTKSEGGSIAFDDAQEAYTSRYNHETVALASPSRKKL